jgi:hypothetical protein
MTTRGENGSALTRSLGVRRVSLLSLPIHRGSAPLGYGMVAVMRGSGCVILPLLVVTRGRCGAAPRTLVRGSPASPIATATIPRTSTSTRAVASWWSLPCRFLMPAFWFLATGFPQIFSALWFIGDGHLSALTPPCPNATLFSDRVHGFTGGYQKRRRDYGTGQNAGDITQRS